MHRTTIGGVILLVFSIAVYAYTFHLQGRPIGGDPGPAFFPRLVAAALFLLSISLIVEGIHSRRLGREGEELERHLFIQQVGILLLTAVYVAVMPYAGFLLSTFVYLLAFFKYAGTQGLVMPGALAVMVDVALFFSFRELLNVPLPEILGI